MGDTKTTNENKKWTAVVALKYPDASGKEKVVKEGETVSDIPSISIKWLVAQGLIKEI